MSHQRTRGPVLAVIPTYRPEASSFKALTASVIGRDVPLLVVDDASPCTADHLLAAAARAGAIVIRHHRNTGIARSLNEGLRLASEQGATWLLTVDQDSALSPDHIERLLAVADAAGEALGADRVGAVAAGGIADASGSLHYPMKTERGVTTTEEVIQTGTLWAVDALLTLGGFDESLGIDAVDAAACLALRSSGRRIVLAPEVAVVHRIGQGRQVQILGRDVLVSGHSPERRTTIVRNRLRLFPAELVESPSHAFRTIRRMTVQTVLAVTIEDNRWAKAKGAARGLLPLRSR